MSRVGLANILTTICLFGLFYILRQIGIHYGTDIGMAFAAGGIFFTVIWQIAHKSRYGVWFDEPVIPPKTPSRGALDATGPGR